MEKQKTSSAKACVEFDITTTPRDLTPENIFTMVTNGIIDMPVFQRNYVWDIRKASRLIESLILGLPIPELFFFTYGDENGSYKVIDGQQRVLSIYLFLAGRFPKTNQARIQLHSKLLHPQEMDSDLKDDRLYKDFKLILEDNEQLNGKSFSELDSDLQVKFKVRRFLRTVVIRQNAEDVNNEAMFQIFSRFNTGCSILSPQEIRASLYYCPFYEMLLELNELTAWRSLIGKPTKSLHSEDVETILRAFALFDRVDTYAPKMAYFLNSFSQATTKFSSNQITSYKGLFKSFLIACESLSPKAFYKSNRFSKTLFESTFVAATKSIITNSESAAHKRIVPETLEQLKNDEIFNSYLLADSTAADNTRGRIARAIEIIRLQ